MIAGSGSFRLGRGSVEISRGWFHLPHRSETSILGVANRPECTAGIGYRWQKYQQYCDEFFALGAGEKRLFQPQVGLLES